MSSTFEPATGTDPWSPGPSTLLEAVYSALDSSVRGSWLVLRGGEESLARGGDVDILVEPGSLARIGVQLESLGFAPVPSAGQGSHRFFLGYDEDHGRWVRLDFASRVDFGAHQELRTDAAPELLARRVRTDDHWRLCDDDAFWHLFLHRFLSERDVQSPELSLLSLHSHPRGPLAILIDRIVVRHASSEELLDLVRTADWTTLSALRPNFDKAWREQRPGALLARTRDGLDRVRHALQGLRRPTGISVTIIGPDGAGKTTLAEGLRETLPFASRYVYMGVWRAYPRDRWLRFVPGLRLAQRMSRLLGRSLQAWFHRLRGRIVLLDRFTYDVLLPSPDLDIRGRITAWLVRRVCAEPQLVIVLNAPAELMFARKGEQGVEELERRRLTYLEIARTRQQSVVIDATQSVEVVRAEAQKAVWARLQQHWNPRA